MWAFTFCFLVFSLFGSSARALTLDQAFELTQKNTESVPYQEEAINQAEEKYRQALGALLPTVSGLASYQWQAAAGGGQFSPTRQPLVRISAQQPLFRGLREFAALKRTSLLAEASQKAKELALQNLFNDVTQSFYLVLSLETECKNLQSQIEALQQRLGDLKKRIRIGRSRLTEALTVEASLNTLKGQLIQTEGQWEVAKESFKFITGIQKPLPLEDRFTIPSKPPAIQSYLDRISQRPDLKIKSLELEAADKAVDIAWGAHLPSIDLNGNYYLKRFGFFDQIPWDIGVSLTLPILNGGLISSQVAEASSMRMQAELNQTQTKRAAEQEIRSLHATFEADLNQLKAFEDARKLNERNFKQLNKEYRNGLVNNLEVLQGLTAFEESKRNLDRAKYQTKIDFFKLETAAGKIKVSAQES